MLCDRCHGREAVVHVTQIINGHRTERHLCRECAAKENLMNDSMGFFGHDLFRNSFDSFFNDGFMNSLFRPARTTIESLSCPECGKKDEDFKKDGLLGCPECYEAFREKLRPAFQHMQGAHRYSGDAPKPADEKKAPEESPELKELREKLSKLVADENYEEAAKVRDEIHKLEDKGSDKGGSSK